MGLEWLGIGGSGICGSGIGGLGMLNLDCILHLNNCSLELSSKKSTSIIVYTYSNIARFILYSVAYTKCAAVSWSENQKQVKL